MYSERVGRVLAGHFRCGFNGGEIHWFCLLYTSMDKMMEDMKPQALKRIQTRLVLEKIAEAEDIQPSEEEITEEIQKMADAYKMEADKIRTAIGEDGLEQMKKDMAVQKAVTVIADAAVEVEKAADAE